MYYSKSISLMIFAGLCLLYITGASHAQEVGNVVVESKTVSGEVGFMNSEYISIIDEKDEAAGYEHETLIYLDDFVDVQRKDSLDEINEGDTVEVQYEKTTKTSKDKKTLQDVRKSKKVAKGVKFLKEGGKKGSKATLKGGKK